MCARIIDTFPSYRDSHPGVTTTIAKTMALRSHRSRTGRCRLLRPLGCRRRAAKSTPERDLCECVGVEGEGRSVPAAAAELHSCSAADTTVGGLAADGWEWSTTFGLRRAAIALAKENNGLDDGLYHLPLQGCGVPDLSNAETAQAQLNRRVCVGHAKLHTGHVTLGEAHAQGTPRGDSTDSFRP